MGDCQNAPYGRYNIHILRVLKMTSALKNLFGHTVAKSFNFELSVVILKGRSVLV